MKYFPRLYAILYKPESFLGKRHTDNPDDIRNKLIIREFHRAIKISISEYQEFIHDLIMLSIFVFPTDDVIENTIHGKIFPMYMKQYFSCRDFFRYQAIGRDIVLPEKFEELPDSTQMELFLAILNGDEELIREYFQEPSRVNHPELLHYYHIAELFHRSIYRLKKKETDNWSFYDKIEDYTSNTDSGDLKIRKVMTKLKISDRHYPNYSKPSLYTKNLLGLLKTGQKVFFREYFMDTCMDSMKSYNIFLKGKVYWLDLALYRSKNITESNYHKIDSNALL